MRTQYDILLHTDPFTAENSKQINRLRNHGHRVHLAFHGMPLGDEYEMRQRIMDNRVGFDSLAFGEFPLIPDFALVRTLTDYSDLNSQGVQVYWLGPTSYPYRGIASMEHFVNTVLFIAHHFDEQDREGDLAA